VSRARRTVDAVVLAARNEDVRRVELAWGAAIVAEWAHFVALGVFAYRTGGASGVGIAGLVRLLPAAFVAPVAAAVGDRFRRERVLLIVALVGAVALAGSAAASSAGSRVLVYVFAAVVGISSTLFRPTMQALLPSLARTPEELIASNGATSTIESVGTLVGPLAAGILVARAPVAVTFAVAAVVVTLGAALITKVDARVHVLDAPLAGRIRVLPMLRSAFETLGRRPGTRLVLALMVTQTFVRGCLNVLIVVAAFRVLHEGAGAVGYMTAAIGVGGLAGAVGAMTLHSRRLASWYAFALVFWGLPIVLIAPRPELVLALVLLAIVGVANSVEDVAGFTLFQRSIPDEALNRVLAVVWGLNMGGVALGSIAAPGIVRAIGSRPAFLLVGALLPVFTALAYRGLVGLDRVGAPGEELALLDRVPMFAPLSLATKERLATKLSSVSVGAGECVFRLGDEGDRFYIVADGAFAIDVGGRRETASAGDYFGEIALLRDVPRTATVTAAVDSRLAALQRDDFLAAITGHPAAEAAADSVVGLRLGGLPTESR
jgi:MFS family permease